MMSGVAYQLLWSLFRFWKTTIQDVRPGPTGLAPEALTLILEPSEGGDLRFGSVVEQIKISRKSWSLAMVIQEVIPDLYKASVGKAPVSLYRFVTEGSMGQWKDVADFWQSLETRKGLRDSPLSLLDSQRELPSAKSNPALAERVRQIGGCGYTERGIFLYIANVLLEEMAKAEGGRAKKWKIEAPEVLHRKLLRLLAGFRFDGGRIESVIKAEVLEELAARGVKDNELQEKCASLVGNLLERAGKGDAAITRDDFLAQHRLQGVRDLRKWDLIVQESQFVLSAYLSRHRYQESEESRESRSFLQRLESRQELKPIVAWGESGQGKSWLFYGTAQERARRGNVVLVLDSTQDVLRDRREAARIFCEKIWGTDEELSLDRIARRVRDLAPGLAEGIWLTLLIDGVRELGYLSWLSVQEWDAVGIRVAVAFTSDRDEPDFSVSEVNPYPVREFSRSEVRRYLRLRLGESHLLPPHDVQQLLRRPLMARLYCDRVASEGQWQPKNEYQLIEEYWNGQASQAPVTIDALVELASLIPGGEEYPWRMARLRSVGIGELDLRHSLRTHLVRLTGGGRLLELWHDRLLQWAIAEGLVSGLRVKRLTSEQLQDQVKACLENDTAGRRFGYVPMDVLWLLADPNASGGQSAEELLQMVEDFEKTLDLVPSLGARIVPHLFSRLRNNLGTSSYAEIRYIKFLEEISDPAVSRLAVEMLHESRVVFQKAAARILASQGSPDGLDRLWELYRDWSRKIEADRAIEIPFGTLPETDELEFSDVVQVGEALSRCVKLAPEWLERAIRKADPEMDPVHTLVFLIPDVREGEKLWRRVKSIAFDKVTADHERCLAVCIATFRDRDELQWLKERVDKKEDMVGSMARMALYLFGSEEAFSPIDPASLDLALGRTWWLRPLQMEYPERTADLLFETIRRAENPWISASFFDGRENWMSEELLEFLLDKTADILATELSCPGPDKRLYRPFSKLEDISRCGLLRVFWRHRGKDLEKNLTAWLIREGPMDNRGRRLTPEAGLAVLRKLGDLGMAKVANAFFERAMTHWGRVEAFDLALRSFDDETVEWLTRIAFMEEEHPILSRNSKTYPLDQREALRVLADLGHDEIVVRGLIRWGLHLPPDFEEYLEGRALDDAQLAPAFTELESDPIPPGAILALGMSRRPEMVAKILSVLSTVDPSSSVALSCLLALEMLQDRSVATEQALVQALDVPDHRNIARRALARLRKLNTSHYVDVDQEARQIWERRHDRLFLLDRADDLELLGRLDDDDEVREFLEELAFSDSVSSFNPSTHFAAVRALRKLSPSSAFEAGEFQVERGLDSYRKEYPKLLLEIDPVRAEKFLGSMLKKSDDFNLLYATGEALDRTGQQFILLGWLRDSAPKLCEGACFAAEAMRWSSDLDDALFALRRAEDWNVREAAWGSLEKVRLQKEVDCLVEAFLREEDRPCRWALLDSALALGHPGVIEGYGQFGWFAELNSKPLTYSMKKYALESLDRRRQELIKELEYRKRV